MCEVFVQNGKLGVLSLLNRLGDGLAGTGAEESLLIVAQQDFPRCVLIATDEWKGDLIEHPLAVPEVLFDVHIPVGDGLFA